MYLSEPKKRNYLWSVNISFGNKKLYRDCVFPETFEIEEIKTYLSESLKLTKKGVIFEVVQKYEVYVTENVKKKARKKEKGFISSHWLDATMYVVYIEDEIHNSEYIIVDELDRCDGREKYFEQFFPRTRIIIFDFRDIWVKRL
ncbi:hypothetical protein [Lactococcus petauri]|uniref:hypothetical protein n=1 Tax=Lactococcus petauri TaxID=1940789 RepID=UPI00254E0D2E|nr:hypothetical protein [Lactococcus petauri]